MKLFEHKLMLLLNQGEQAAIDLYAALDDESRVRKVLRSTEARGWTTISRRTKMSDGPGRPMNHYSLTELGIDALANHEAELESFR